MMRLMQRLTPRSFGGVVLISMLISVGLAISTTVVVSVVVSPVLLRWHLRAAERSVSGARIVDSEVVQHVEMAARYANGISLAISLLIGVVAAVISSLYLSRQLNAAMGRVAVGAREISKGNYAMRLTSNALGDDMAALAGSFNDMASKLEDSELHRQRLFSDLAHEIRTPVSIIDAQMEAVEDGITPSSDAHRVLRVQADRLVALSDDLGLLSRAEEGRLDYDVRPVDVTTIVRDAVASMAVTFEQSNVTLEAAPSAPVMVTADRQRLLQVMGNLLNNALHATSSGGSVHIRIRKQATTVAVSVIDDGRGLSREQLDHIFERLYRVDTARSRSDGGSGIGLAVSAQLIAAHHGTLRAASDGIAKGSTFTVTLPC